MASVVAACVLPAGVALACGTAGVVPAGGILGTDMAAADGTVLSPCAPVVLALAGVAGAACSLPHSIHNNVATISQAKSKKARVWFMVWGSSTWWSSGKQARPAQSARHQERGGGACLWCGAAGIVPS